MTAERDDASAVGREWRLLRGAVALAMLAGLAGCGTGGVEPTEPFLPDGLPPGSSGALVAGRWSYGEIARDPAGDTFVFWVANRSAGDGWDLGESGGVVTSALFERLAGGG